MHKNNYVVKGDGMRGRNLVVLVLVAVFLFGCAHIDFDDSNSNGNGKKGLAYYEPMPFLLVNTTSDCMSTASLVILPGARRTVKLESGYGTADLSLKLSSSGMISEVGQVTDTKIPDTINAITSLGTSAMGLRSITLEEEPAKKPESGKKDTCKIESKLYPIKDGNPDFSSPLAIPVTKE